MWVSSVEKAGLEGNYAVDGFESTRWSSAFKENQWIIVNLQKKYTINRIELSREAAFAKEFYVLCGNDTTMLSDTVAHITNDDGGSYFWDTNIDSAKYIKIYCVKRGTEYGNSLYEIRAFGKSSNTTGINKVSKLNNIHVYPNPASDNINVTLPEAEQCIISIFDINGKLIQQEQHNTKTIQLNINPLGKGIYYIRSELKSGFLTEKIIKF